MANEFFTILTATGRNKLAAATATGTALTLTQMAVGDGDNGAYYSPTEAQTALKHEVWRGAINHLAVDANNPNWIVAELVIPDNVGGFYIREVGLFDSTGAMIAVGKFPESYKPTLAAGSNKQLYVRMILEVANTSAVTLLVDPSVVLATRQYCDDTIWMLKTDGAIIIGATPIAFQWAGGLNAPTQAPGDNSAKIANTSFVQAAIAALVASSPAALDTLNELAAALGNDANFAATVTNALALKAPLASPALTDSPTAPTQAQFDSSTKLATTAFVQRALGGFGNSYAYGTAGQTIPASRVNSNINLYGTCTSITLPLSSSVPVGSAILFTGISLPCAVNRQGTDTIFLNAVNNAATSVTVSNGGWLLMVATGGGWFASGTATLKYSDEFAASMSGNGYQKLPSGLIIQWGTTAVANGAQQTVTYPIAFTVGGKGFGGVTGAGNASQLTFQIHSGTTTGFTWSVNNSSNAYASGVTATWIAVGF